ncbi:MAG: protein-glutamate O-methyltransferase CheR [Deltaproteobacteria bacterium]|jgi:chemotaxis protein methyltransferase CheR|nr:protein-glutamate O-methyltransferase CheR [Deltaproteobacteria bacterium]
MKNDDQNYLMEILAKVHDRTGFDFTQYKDATLIRRIKTRLRRLNIATYKDYIGILDSDDGEYYELINTITINVTEFFRNVDSFKAIEELVVPALIESKRKRRHHLFRIWSCACSDGDEAYSMAILLKEQLQKQGGGYTIRVTGSDIDEEALGRARKGSYEKTRLKAVNRELLDQYFEEVEEGVFRIKGCIRDIVKFRQHDIIKDRAIRHNDIILCRNLLIYFNKQLQEETLLKLYECLNPGGFLILGMCETLVGSALERFEGVNNRLRIYRRPSSIDPADRSDEGSATLSQQDVDKLVGEILD